MRRDYRLILMAVAWGWAETVFAQLQVVPGPEAQRVFAGDGRTISVVFRNAEDKAVEADVRMRLYQVSSATVIPLGEMGWKRLQVLAGQTVLESARLDFPVVKAETRFLVQWLDGTNRVMGRTEVLVYPTNLLQELEPLAGGRPIGLFDPQDQLKPLLSQLGLEVEDLEEAGVSTFPGKLAILGPFGSRVQMAGDLADRVAALARKGCAVVWIQPSRERDRKLTPTFYAVPLGGGMVVVAQAQMVAGLADDPQAQLDLIRLAEYAVRRELPRLPDQTPLTRD
jgi:hypothetical protein